MILKIFLTIVLITGVGLVSIYVYQSTKIRNNPNQKLFVGGKLPIPPLDGFYRGSAFNFDGDWQGKRFEAANSNGVNVFKETDGRLVERHRFKTYTSPGIQDPIETFKLDYRVPGNIWWIKFFIDELVEITPGQYLGKIYLRPLGLIAIPTGYFKLSRE